MKPIDPLERGPSKSATANWSRLSTLSHDGIFAREQQTPGRLRKALGSSEN
jgi:hypothetical protein